MRYIFMVLALGTTLTHAVERPASKTAEMNRWTAEKANKWYATHPWLVGCNFIPSTAINQLEMWQAETFDPETIDRELGSRPSRYFRNRSQEDCSV